jgi:excisionase family DNA binding protein
MPSSATSRTRGSADTNPLISPGTSTAGPYACSIEAQSTSSNAANKPPNPPHSPPPHQTLLAAARLVGPDGTQLDIPDELYEVLRDVVTALSQGLAISIVPHNTMLTTQEAADLLNISRPTLVRLLTDGEIPYTMRGRHRRVMLRDIVDYRDRTCRERRRALDQMTADAEDDGLYEVTATPKRTR